jgi:hypothetical protein
MSLRDDVRWVRDAADGLLVGALPGRLPKWSTSEGEQLGWLVLMLWTKYVETTMARGRLEAEVARLKDDVNGLRDTNERLTDMLLDEARREATVAALVGDDRPAGYYWVHRYDGDTDPTLAFWDEMGWWVLHQEIGTTTAEPCVHQVLAGPLPPPGVPGPP